MPYHNTPQKTKRLPKKMNIIEIGVCMGVSIPGYKYLPYIGFAKEYLGGIF
jgi:hypothetical protein